jgi:replicative superfamily II helicase
MNLPDLRNNNVILFLNKEDIIRETAAQIMKDFGMFGIEITFSGEVENAYYELHDQLVNHISEYLNRDYGKLMSVFYQVDITEKEIQRTANEMPEYNEIEVLAHQVIFRDLKKVLFRRYYKSKTEY